MVNVKERGAPSFENRTTIQSYYKIAMWQPWGLLQYINPTPIMMIVPEMDKISNPDDQKQVFNDFKGPKRLVTASEKGHLDVLSGAGSCELMSKQLEFIDDFIGRR